MASHQKEHSQYLTSVETHQQGVIQDANHVHLGYTPQLKRNRSMATILFMTLAIAAIPYGEGSTLMVSIYGGGQLAIFVGLLVVLALTACVAVSLAELASRFPTSSGPYYWSYRVSKPGRTRNALSFLTGWVWLTANWLIALSVNFGVASLLMGTVSIYDSSFTANQWQFLLIFFAVTMTTFFICAVGDRYLPVVDTMAAIWTLVTAVALLIALAATAKSGRHSASYGLAHYDTSFAGWGHGFTFFIGLLPHAYTFCAIGMVSSMSEEVADPEVDVPKAITLCVPIGGAAALLFLLPICFTLPAMADIISEAPYGQALPYIVYTVMGTQGGAVAIMVLVLMVGFFCSISITTTASRCTWAFSRDRGLPFHNLWSSVVADRPIYALCLVTVTEMLLGLIELGSSSAFTAFASVGVIGLSVGYLIPIAISLFSGRKEVAQARWTPGHLIGTTVNVVAVCWILFELVLFSMPTALPVTAVSMNYASVVFVGFLTIGMVWYALYAHKRKSPPPY
jgi:amino acid transporter